MRNRTLCRVCAGSICVFALGASAFADITHVLWSTFMPSSLQLGSLADGSIVTLDSSIVNFIGDFEYDPVSRKIYFGSFITAGVSGIRRMNPDGTGSELIVTIPSNLGTRSLTLDPVARKVYYGIRPNSTTFQESVRRADMDALDSNIEILVTGEEFVGDLQVDPSRNAMYWATRGIKTAPMSGGAATTLITDNFKFTDAIGGKHCLRGPGAITIDKSTGLLYVFAHDGREFCGFANPFIATISPSGSISILIIKPPAPGLPRIEHMVFDHMNQQLYFTNVQSSDIGMFDPATLQFFTPFVSPVGIQSQKVSVAFLLPPPCPGDANADGSINFGDVTTILANWLASSCPAGSGSCGIEGVQGDANDDGQVNFGDITAVLGGWLGVCP